MIYDFHAFNDFNYLLLTVYFLHPLDMGSRVIIY